MCCSLIKKNTRRAKKTLRIKKKKREQLMANYVLFATTDSDHELHLIGGSRRPDRTATVRRMPDTTMETLNSLLSGRTSSS